MARACMSILTNGRSCPEAVTKRLMLSRSVIFANKLKLIWVLYFESADQKEDVAGTARDGEERKGGRVNFGSVLPAQLEMACLNPHNWWELTRAVDC